RQRRRSNSSSDILAHANIKAVKVKSPGRDASHKEYPIPRPPRLAFSTTPQPFAPKIPMTPPTNQEYNKYLNTNMIYCNDAGMLRGGSQYPSPRVTRTTSFGSNTSTNSGRSISTGVYNECIKKTTSFDDEDSVSDSCSSSEMVDDDDNESSFGAIDSTLAKEVTMLRKEIDSVKSSLAGLQKDHVEMLNEKKQLEEQYNEAKAE
ncbi:9527_t:CDS:1, partial [Acaulospora morrowiae]